MLMEHDVTDMVAGQLDEGLDIYRPALTAPAAVALVACGGGGGRHRQPVGHTRSFITFHARQRHARAGLALPRPGSPSACWS